MFEYSRSCTVLVREEKAFGNLDWLSLGSITLDNSASFEKLRVEVQRGAFEWLLPDFESVQSSLGKLLGIKIDDKSAAAKLRRALDAIASISTRVGLQHPKFDPFALEMMPFRRSTTVVADTSGAIQGGLDFVARYLHPAARVKVPAIVHMEIVNFADRFLSGRRAAKTRPTDLLIDHLMSQGGQRVLLRLELSADTEIERSFILGDPLRSAFQSEKDSELTELNLSVPIRAYADRLILETARQHQAQANLGHKVQLLTSDQGLARMALAEGVVPLFFKSASAADLFGQRLTGTTFDPFSGRLHETSIASLLWELATAFGTARLASSDKAHSLTISAIGEGLSWSPYQSHADLLWCDQNAVPKTLNRTSSQSQNRAVVTTSSRRGATPERQVQKTSAKRATKSSASHTTSTVVGRVSFQRLNAEKLFTIVDILDDNQSLSEDKIVKAIGAKDQSAAEEYRRFLSSADFIGIDKQDWTAKTSLQELAIALRAEDVSGVRKLLLKSPSFSLFAQRISGLQVGETIDLSLYARAANTYRALGEVTLLCAPVGRQDLYPTSHIPDVREFAVIALRRFRDLDQGDGLVSTGAWLEELIRKDGIHPEISRLRLNDASANNLLRRSTEGSTTEVRFDDHTIQVLRIESGRPVIASVHLYRGDYLIPGESSTSLRIEEALS
jgi:hypothetical protein